MIDNRDIFLKFAVFGSPILHSCSPQLFNSVFEHKLTNARYTRIRPDNGEQIAYIIRSFGLTGANITTPYKSAVIPYLQQISDEALAIGAVNTIVNRDGNLIGYNTDYIGVTKSLVEVGCHLNGCKCLVIGAGPAAAAAIYGLTRAGAKVNVTSRTMQKAQHLALKFRCEFISLDRAKLLFSEYNVVVSAIPPSANPIDDVRFESNQLLLDSNYRKSAIGYYAQQFDSKLISGKRWLLHQAIAAYSKFFGEQVDTEVMEQGFDVELKKDNLRIAPLSGDDFNADLLITNTVDFKCIADEEISKTFDS